MNGLDPNTLTALSRVRRLLAAWDYPEEQVWSCSASWASYSRAGRPTVSRPGSGESRGALRGEHPESTWYPSQAQALATLHSPLGGRQGKSWSARGG